MSLRLRILTLLGLVLLGFCVALLVLHRVQGRNVDDAIGEIAREKQALLDRVAEVTGTSLRQFSRDYTQWTEMCDFVARPDPAWAKVNIDASLETWRFHAAWLIRADGVAVYGANRLGDEALREFPLPAATLLAGLRAEPFRHFFLPTRHGPMEIRTAPVQPSEDNERKEAARGWMLVGKLWDDAQLAQIGGLAGGAVDWLAPGEPAARRNGDTVAAVLTLRDWSGEPVRRLRLTVAPPLGVLVEKGDEAEWILFFVWGSVMLAALAWGLRRFVVQPIERIGLAMAGDTAAPLLGMEKQADEFRRIAQLFETSLRRKLSLQLEIEERRRAEQALRDALEERAQLGRDLHDQIIQSIYAAGLKTEGAAKLVHTDPAEAGRRLGETVAALNEIIVELRHVITGTNPKEQPGVSLSRGLRRLADSVRDSHRMSCNVEVDEAATQTLTRDEREELLGIAREAVTNALRHSGGTTIAVRFGAKLPARWLEIVDDGAGFVPAELPARGHGLDNMTRRAEEIGADCEIDSAPGRGTRVRIELPPLSNRLG